MTGGLIQKLECVKHVDIDDDISGRWKLNRESFAESILKLGFNVIEC